MLCFATCCWGVLQVKVIYATGSCEGKVELWEEGLWDVKIYHFYELFTSVMPYPETTTQVFNLFLVKPCLENLHSSSGSRWTFVYFQLWLIDQTICAIFQLQRYTSTWVKCTFCLTETASDGWRGFKWRLGPMSVEKLKQPPSCTLDPALKKAALSHSS